MTVDEIIALSDCYDVSAGQTQTIQTYELEVGPPVLRAVPTESKGSTRDNFPPSVVEVLKTWLMGHFDDPYPTAQEKEHLALETGITYEQVQHWFINARMRIWRPMLKGKVKSQRSCKTKKKSRISKTQDLKNNGKIEQTDQSLGTMIATLLDQQPDRDKDHYQQYNETLQNWPSRKRNIQEEKNKTKKRKKTKITNKNNPCSLESNDATHDTPIVNLISSLFSINQVLSTHITSGTL